MKRQYKTGKTQREAVKRYQARNPERQAGIGATFTKSEKEYIQAIYKRHGVTPAQVMRGAAAALADGQQIRIEREPLPALHDESGTQSD